MKSVLYPPTIDWDFLFQRPQHLMTQFAKNNWKVHYINKTQRYKNVEELRPNLYLHHDFSIFLKRVKKVDILYISSPRQYCLCDKIEADLVIYDCVDKFNEWVEYEEEIMKKADIIFAASQYLYEEKKKYHDKVFLIRNACDYEYFQNKMEVPLDISRLKRPLVALIGAMGKWVDKKILARVANEFPTVLIGQEFGNNLPEGVINLGSKSYTQLPYYYNNIDVGLIPFDKSDTSKAANPVKMYEYLAAGKPVVGSKLTELEIIDEVCTVDGPGEFIEQINKALAKDCIELKEKRKKIARENTWEKRFEKIESILIEYLS